VNNVKSEPPQRPEWTEEDKIKILQVAEQYGEDWDRMVAAVGNKSRRSVMKKVGRVKDRFDAKETLNDWEQKMILAINKPKTVTATTTQIEKEIEAEKPATDAAGDRRGSLSQRDDPQGRTGKVLQRT